MNRWVHNKTKLAQLRMFFFNIYFTDRINRKMDELSFLLIYCLCGKLFSIWKMNNGKTIKPFTFTKCSPKPYFSFTTDLFLTFFPYRLKLTRTD